MFDASDITFTIYDFYCAGCGKFYKTPQAYLYDDKPTVCPVDGQHQITITSSECFTNFLKPAEKGDIYLRQFLMQHKNRNGESDFAPIVIEPTPGKILELTRVDVVWHERLISNSHIVWEFQMNNPFFDPESPISPSNPEHIALSQFYYRDFSELWAGAYSRPISDGPTREMQHIFTDRNSRENRNPFILKSSLGMRIYAYSTNDAKRVDGEGVSYNTVGGMKIYIPYTENTITDGKYPLSTAASYPVDFVPECECDDCYSLNAIGALFDEV